MILNLSMTNQNKTSEKQQHSTSLIKMYFQLDLPLLPKLSLHLRYFWL